MGVTWTDADDGVIAGDLTAALAYVTPAGGAVVAAIAPIGLRDRAAGSVGFTTSLGFGRKLDRIRAEPRVALAYHAREHGFCDDPRYLLVQGQARVDHEPDRRQLDEVVAPASTRFLGPPRRGVFWDRWLAAYYRDRVLVDVDVARIAMWPDLGASGTAQVAGAQPAGHAAPQAPPRNGIGPRVDVARAARRLRRLPHRLLSWRGADGYPVIVPFTVAGADPDGLRLAVGDGLLPPGGRRAGVLAHRFNPQLVGLEARQHTGWLTVADDGTVRYAPHTQTGFVAPANKTLLLLLNGYLARRGLARARRVSQGLPGRPDRNGER